MGVDEAAAEARQERLTGQPHEARRHHQVGRMGRNSVRKGRIPLLAAPVVLDAEHEGGHAARAGPVECRNAGTVRTYRHHDGAVRRVVRGVEQGRQVGAAARDQHDESPRIGG
jgi:hypothetical protein